MNCEDVKRNISAYIDEELDQEDRDVVGRHLSECAYCRHYHTQISAIAKGVFSLSRLSLSPSQQRELQETVDAEWKKRARRKGFLAQLSRPGRLALAAASVAAFLLIAFVLSQLGGVLEMTTPMRAAEEAPAPQALEMELQIEAVEGQEEAEVVQPPKLEFLEGQIMVEIGARNYSAEEVDEIFHSHPFVQSFHRTYDLQTYDLNSIPSQKETLIRIMLDQTPPDNGYRTELSAAFGAISQHVADGGVVDLDWERFDALSLPVYAERARFEGKEVWIVLFLLLGHRDNGKVRLRSLVFVVDVGTDGVMHSSARATQ
ncbi:hypothetical protein HKBW3S03_00313 [Candidatus Hakubella thermalkaliphila]|uniref:Putative zinc-finger domain-containing protein n=2 Tax=Candidatus Hakubella thermalkaliphila TaxID=2754717 RepID=A0A6V8NF46_9ACTN|nr:zf-HC2 domain-containing protein [Candidatus Hakubella thermalkaliphila]GFP18808.1 hypothetical protein HKBW3S03_00313 [Candidatus Hakubella thermalkaliphila]GFP29677.1 hypothetical protein HKBW3S34_00597 [Candidatus Hakubella thermalkaliphila]GFP36376.1 hypothetical protein HKBW3S44_00059 [Candidatus Hakubella thermalkaliphila]